jgi:hypothetical protein
MQGKEEKDSLSHCKDLRAKADALTEGEEGLQRVKKTTPACGTRQSCKMDLTHASARNCIQRVW